MKVPLVIITTFWEGIEDRSILSFWIYTGEGKNKNFKFVKFHILSVCQRYRFTCHVSFIYSISETVLLKDTVRENFDLFHTGEKFFY